MVGDYRLQFEARADAVVVLRVRHAARRTGTGSEDRVTDQVMASAA